MSSPQPNQEDAELERELDDIMEDLIIGHNFDYARKAILRLFHEELERRQPLFTTNPCGYCGAPVAPVITVTRKQYCNHSHRTLAYNVRKAQLSKDNKEQPHV